MVYQTKKLFLSLLLVLVGLGSKNQQQLGTKDKGNNASDVAEAIQVAKNKDIFRSATIGLYAVNLTHNKVISDINAATSLTPASTLKLLTTAAALEVLGKDFRFKTTIQYDGNIDEHGTLHGNVYIKGGGDPALGSMQFKKHYYQPYFMETWVQAVQGKGIKRIEGAVIGDAQIYTDFMVPDTWALGNLREYYGAGVSGLSIFDNIYTITFNAAPEGVPVQIIDIFPPLPDEMQVISQVKGAAINHKRIHIGGGLPYHNVRVIQGEIPCNKQKISLKGSSPDPPYWAAYSFCQELQKTGIEVTQPPTTIQRAATPLTDRQEVYTTLSPPLSDIIKCLNHDSLNSYAEHLLKHLSLAASRQGNTQSGARALKKFWSNKGIDTTGMLIYDGSGLSKYDALTPKQLVEVLCYMKNSENFTPFYESLPIAGKTGNLNFLFQQPPLKANIRAKSGALSNVRGFAGYCTNVIGEEIVVAIIVNHYDGSLRNAEAELEKILTVLLKQK